MRYVGTTRLLTLSLSLALAGCGSLSQPVGDDDEGWIVVDEEPTSYSDEVGEEDADLPSDEEEPRVEPTEPPVDPPVDPPVEQPIEAVSCTLEHARLAETWWVEPSLTTFTPNGGLFVSVKDYGQQPHVMNVADGSEYLGSTFPGLRVTDRAWRFGAFDATSNQPEIRDLRTGAVIATPRVDETYYTLATVSPDGSTGAFLECGRETARAEIIDLTGDSERRTVELGPHEYCWAWSPAHHGFVLSDDGRYLVATIHSKKITLVDTVTLETSTLAVHESPDDQPTYSTVISDVVMRPGGRELVTTGRDGFLRRWAIPSLEQIGEDLEVGVFSINENTYAPQLFVSPVVFTADGRSMAYVDTDRNVRIVNDGGVTVLETPEYEAAEDIARTPNVPVAMAFSDDGDRFGVGYYWGPAVYGCPGKERARHGTLHIEVPERVDAVDNRVDIPVSFVGGAAYTAWNAVTSDGHSGASYEDGMITLWVDRASGPVTLTIEATDGVAEGSVTTTVTPVTR